MGNAGHILNVILGLCAIGYSYLPPHRIRHYKRSISLLMRILGFFLLIISVTSLLLSLRP